jgi:hypothetical protein
VYLLERVCVGLFVVFSGFFGLFYCRSSIFAEFRLLIV